MNRSKVYFENLDGFRFIAFFVVFAAHATGFNYFSTINSGIHHFIPNAYLGVSFFFVLSGFLITYLLLSEKMEASQINLGHFYVRRILRIWPVYFVVILLGFFLVPRLFEPLPNFNTSAVPIKEWFYYVFFFPNFNVLDHKEISPVLSVLWSVGVEEQFYFFWPLLLTIIPTRKLPLSLMFIILGSLAFKNYYYLKYDNFDFSHYHTLGVISDLGLGALGACYAFNNNFLDRIRKVSRANLYFVYAIGFLLMIIPNFLNGQIPNLVRSLLELASSFFFLVIILEQNFSVVSFFKMKNLQKISACGTYTYGLYCYHLFSIFITLKCLETLTWTPNAKFCASIFLSFASSLLISYLSYEFFEKRFLAFKNRFI